MTEVVIYHNPRCSKSRQTLELLEQRGITPTIVPYLETPLSSDELRLVVSKLGLSSVRELMRTKESIYQELELAREQSEQQLLLAVENNPKLMERPVVVYGERAAIGRPPEQVLKLFE
ncbi:arsenate reductase (glutaredoxin) [Dongshaea marina]|uniref:arsenate reductase (glutaredoxin) n=1 Tax=Dongshaea marina TaxID=2047966 RepID=UPI000D3ED186|nr:arsenate reductase (glutaredoxin) [Dongshaea marina]